MWVIDIGEDKFEGVSIAPSMDGVLVERHLISNVAASKASLARKRL